MASPISPGTVCIGEETAFLVGSAQLRHGGRLSDGRPSRWLGIALHAPAESSDSVQCMLEAYVQWDGDCAAAAWEPA